MIETAAAVERKPRKKGLTDRERQGRRDRYRGRTAGDKRAKGVLLLIMRRGQVEVEREESMLKIAFNNLFNDHDMTMASSSHDHEYLARHNQ